MPLKTLTELDPKIQYWTSQAVAWMDRQWDEAAGLLYYADDWSRHTVRESVWYAQGLLLRGNPDDVARACRAIEQILSYQFDEPAAVYHGTFYRYPQEPHPPAQPTQWLDYDPNWREFIGTSLALILEEYESLLSSALIEAIDRALFKAAEGAARRDVSAHYTNIALMSAYLSDFVGARLGEPAWRARAERLAGEIYTLFELNKTFEEYNSPTYYGVDLYALAQWRAYGLTDQLRDLGSRMEADLWRDVGCFYHAGLKNLCGPYDRSYGMDLRQYVGLVGAWIAATIEPADAPLPDIHHSFDHQHDLCFVPVIAFAPPVVPADVGPQLQQFAGPRQIERTITADPKRVATAYLAAQWMIGGEFCQGSRNATGQFHPATMHWQMPDGRVGWLRLICPAPVDATASAETLSITCHFDRIPRPEEEAVRFEIYAPATDLKAIQADSWPLPGLTLRVEASLDQMDVLHQGELFEIQYSLPPTNAAQIQTFRLTVEK